MNNPLFDMSPYQSSDTRSYSADWRDATGIDPAWDKPEFYPDLEDNIALATNNAESNSKEAPTMAEERTPEPKPLQVEVVEELSPLEEADRQRLELKVERAWEEGARALQELRDRRLYRDLYQNFQHYCWERFGFTRQATNFKIAAAGVMKNLTTFSCQILPTKETQVRPFTKLQPDEQLQVWEDAVEQNGGKVPTERIVKDAVLRHKGIVEQLKEKNSSPLEFTSGDVVEIQAAKRSHVHPFNGMWGMIEHVGSFSYTVRISIARDTQQCRGEEIKRVDDEYAADIKSVGHRIAALAQFDLEPIEYDILSNLQRSKCFTPTQLQLLEWLEQKHLTA